MQAKQPPRERTNVTDCHPRIDAESATVTRHCMDINNIVWGTIAGWWSWILGEHD
jgi:hypothetical protein